MRRRWLLASAALAAVAAAVIALSSGVDEGLLAPAESAAVLLARAADAARRAPAPGALGPGEYLYVRRTAMEPKRITRGGERFTVFIRYVDEDWTARDGSGRSRSRPAQPSFPSPRDKAAYERADSPNNRDLVGNHIPIMGSTDTPRPARPPKAFPARNTYALSYRQVRALATDPAALEQRLRADTGSLRGFDGASREAMTRLRLLERIGGLLAGAPLDAGQRAALFRVAAGIPGVEVSADGLDRLGRRGTAVRLEARIELNAARPPHRKLPTTRAVSIVFDPASGALLGTRFTVADRSGRIVADHGAVYSAEVRRSRA